MSKVNELWRGLKLSRLKLDIDIFILDDVMYKLSLSNPQVQVWFPAVFSLVVRFLPPSFSYRTRDGWAWRDLLDFCQNYSQKSPWKNGKFSPLSMTKDLQYLDQASSHHVKFMCHRVKNLTFYSALSSDCPHMQANKKLGKTLKINQHWGGKGISLLLI